MRISCAGGQTHGVASFSVDTQHGNIGKVVDSGLAIVDPEPAATIRVSVFSQYAATFGIDFSPDGSILVTSGWGIGQAGTVRFWDMDPEAWKARACTIAGRNLTRAEWDRYLPDVPYEITCQQWPAGE